MAISQPSVPKIARADIERVVASFYEAVRRHPGLGPVFAAHVSDWPAHEAKVAAFWAGAILQEHGYDGNVVAAHVAAGNVQPGMFSVWLSLFDTILKRELNADQAAAWSELAHRIGRSLRASVVDRETLPGGVPKLR